MLQNFPTHKKYISLFPKQDSEESKAKREEMLQKLVKVAEVKTKIRDKEILELEQESDEEQKIIKKNKEIEQKDSFFTT